MQAYKNYDVLRAAFISEMDWHKEQDKIISGTYRQGTNGDFKGCFIGCAVHSLSKIKGEALQTDRHQLLEDLLDIPVEIAHLADAIFESLPSAENRSEFAVKLPRAIPLGADLSMTGVKPPETSNRADLADLAYRASEKLLALLAAAPVPSAATTSQ